MDVHRYNATVMNWLDSDTCELCVDLGFETARVVRFRLRGVHTKTLRNSSYFEVELAKSTVEFYEKLCPAGKVVLIKTYRDGGQYLCDIYVDGTTISQILIREGHAEPD